LPSQPVSYATVTFNSLKESVNKEGAVQAVEDWVSELIFPDLKVHLNYLNDVYIFAFLVQKHLDGQRIANIPDLARAQFMILMRITDFVRCIQLLCVKGYPEQAGTLAASVFELAHSALFMERDADKATEWLGAGSIEDQMPREVLGTNWREVVRLNTRDSGEVTVAEREYQVYIQLCWMKHSLPKMQDMRVEGDGKVGLIFGPYSDERSINHAWFAMQHAGRLTELVMGLLVAKFGDEELATTLNGLTQVRDSLRQSAIARFGDANPFLDPTA
jgi:hypothetical protein